MSVTVHSRGCHHACVDTQDFLALPFYQKRGYAVSGELEDVSPRPHAVLTAEEATTGLGMMRSHTGKCAAGSLAQAP
jgi:hypothetical protein